MKKMLAWFLIVFISINYSNTALAQNQLKKKTHKSHEQLINIDDNSVKEIIINKKLPEDRPSFDYTGPNNELIFTNSNSKYYYKDKKGNKHYIKKKHLKEKKENSWLVDGMQYV